MSDFILLCIGVFLGFLLSFFLIMVPLLTPNTTWQGAAIERGYGLYCPNNGNFAWKGECSE